MKLNIGSFLQLAFQKHKSSFKWCQWFIFAPESQLLYFWIRGWGISQMQFSLACLCCCLLCSHKLLAMQATEITLLLACPLIPAQRFSRSAVKHVKSAGEPRYVQASRVQACFLLMSSEWSDGLGVSTNYKCHEDSNVCVWKDHVISCDSVCQSNFTAVLLASNTPGQYFLCVTCTLVPSVHLTPTGYLCLVNNYCWWWDLSQAPVSSITYCCSHSMH